MIFGIIIIMLTTEMLKLLRISILDYDQTKGRSTSYGRNF